MKSNCRTYIQQLRRLLKYGDGDDDGGGDDDDDDGGSDNDGRHYPFRTSGSQVGLLLSLHPRIH